MRKGREGNVLVLSLTTFLSLFGFFSWYFLFPLYLKRLGASDTAIGFLYSLFSLGFTFAQILGGYLADRFGRKALIAWPTFLIAFFYFLMLFSNEWVPVAFLCFLTFVASAIQWPAFTAMLGESSEKRGEAFGRFEFFLALGIGGGPLLGSFLVERIGIKGLILASSLLTLVAATWRILALVETFGKRKEEVSQEVGKILERGREYLPFLVIGSLVFMAIGLTVNGPFLTLFHGEVLGHSRSRINRLFAHGNLIGALFVILAGKLADRWGAKKVLFSGVLIHTLLIVFWALTGSSLLFVSSIPFVQWIYLAYQVVLVEITKEEERGRKVGLFGTITGGMGSLSPLFGSLMKKGMGDLSPFFAALGFASLSLLPSRWMRGRAPEEGSKS